MKFEDSDPAEVKARFKVVRTDSYADVPGEIVAADDTNGECQMRLAGETKSMCFGPHGIRIVGRGRA